MKLFGSDAQLIGSLSTPKSSLLPMTNAATQRNGMSSEGIAKHSLRTYLEDEHVPLQEERVRGARFWSGAEFEVPRWFLAEVRILVEEPKLVSFVSASLGEVQRFLSRHPAAEWSRVYVRMRAPSSEGWGMMFEEVHEAYYVEKGSLILHLANGLVVMERDPDLNGIGDSATVSKVFSRSYRNGPLQE